MWGHKKVKEWVYENFVCKADVSFKEQQYWEMWHRVNALYEHLNVVYQHCPGKSMVVKKGGKGCQQ